MTDPIESGSIARAWRGPTRGGVFDRQLARSRGISDVTTRLELACLSRLGSPARVLEIGAGTGRTSIPAARLWSGRLVALDASPTMLAALAAKDRPPNLDLVAGVALGRLPFVEACFDLAMGFGIVPLFPDWSAVLEPVISVLKPGGTILFGHRNAQGMRRYEQTGRRLRGSFEPASLVNDLAGLGLDLVAVYPTAFFHTPFYRFWGLTNLGRTEAIIRRRQMQAVNDLLCLPDVAALWASVEAALGEVLPSTFSVTAMIVARRSDGSPPPRPHLITDDDPEGSNRAAAKVLASPELEVAVSNPAVKLLLCLLEPSLFPSARGPSPLAEVMTDYDRVRSEASDWIQRLGHPGLAARASHYAGRALHFSRRAYQAVRIRLARLGPAERG
jgi:SAM-dependent methyltransferase